MAEQPTKTDLHHRFRTLMSSADLDDLREVFERADGSDPPPRRGGLARLSGMAKALADTPLGEGIRIQLTALLTQEWPKLTDDELVSGLSPVQWFLEHAAAGKLRLTPAGYLSPDVVREACDTVPRHLTPYRHAFNREAYAPELLRFREALAGVGLLRVQGRKLVPTPMASQVREEPWDLFGYLSSTLVPQDSDFGRDAVLLLLLQAATEPGCTVSLDALAEDLSLVGWRVGRDTIYNGDLVGIPAAGILGNLAAGRLMLAGMGLDITPVASALAREALLSWNLER